MKENKMKTAQSKFPSKTFLATLALVFFVAYVVYFIKYLLS